MSQLQLRLPRLAHILWLMGFNNLKLLASTLHLQAIVADLFHYARHTTLTHLEYQVLLGFASCANPDVEDDDFENISKSIQQRHHVALNTCSVRDYLNSAVQKLAGMPELCSVLMSRGLTRSYDREPERLVLENHIIALDDLSDDNIIDADGRVELLERLLGQGVVADVKHRLVDSRLVERIDHELESVCGQMSQPEQQVVRTIYGVGAAKLGLVGLMQERTCHLEVVQRERNAALDDMLHRGAAYSLKEILSLGGPVAVGV